MRVTTRIGRAVREAVADDVLLLILVIFATLNIFDAMTTIAALNLGAVERMPGPAWLFAHVGLSWGMAAKFGAAGLIVFGAALLGQCCLGLVPHQATARRQRFARTVTRLVVVAFSLWLLYVVGSNTVVLTQLLLHPNN